MGPMRRLLCLLALVGCGKQLNAEYCQQKANANDPDCINAGFTRTDAPAPCTDDSTCPGQVCDTMKGECVACTSSDFAMCPNATPKCGPDDQCHACLTDIDCPAGGMCLPDLTCASSDMFLYATPMPMPTPPPDCSKAAPCKLATAIGMLDRKSVV